MSRPGKSDWAARGVRIAGWVGVINGALWFAAWMGGYAANWSAYAISRTDSVRRANETRLKNLTEVMEHAYEPLIVRDAQGVVRAWNRGAEELYGWPAVEALGRHKHDLLRTEGREAQAINRQLQQTGRWEGELVHHTRDGGRVIVESRKTASRGEDGQLFVLECNRDITARKQADEQLARDLTERKVAEEKLKVSLLEKEVLLREIHHRVKNNLQVVSSLISLQTEKHKDAPTRDVFIDLRDRVRAMALVHDKLYQSGDLAHLNFAEYAASLMEHLWYSQGATAVKVRLDLKVEPVPMTVDLAVQCGLILNELASNALKHAFPNGAEGDVTVGLQHDASTGVACLRVHDNGIGLPKDFGNRQSHTLGLRLVHLLAGQLRGKVAMGAGPGTEFQVAFTVKH